MWDAGQVGCRTGGMRDRRDAGQVGCTIGGGLQDGWNTGQGGSGQMEYRAGQVGSRKGGMQDGRIQDRWDA